METEVAGEENARGNANDLPLPPKKELALKSPPERRPPKLPPQKPVRDPAIALMALRL